VGIVDLNNLKIEYNRLLKREKNAENYLTNVATDAEVEKWMPEFIKITNQLSNMMFKLEKILNRERKVIA
jgi:cob(I)alamin adenosyltransferase